MSVSVYKSWWSRSSRVHIHLLCTKSNQSHVARPATTIFSRKGAKTQRKTGATRQRFASLRLCARNLPRL